MLTALWRSNRPRRGVTLVEMSVVVVLIVLVMIILVQVFQSALGAMDASRTTQELEITLRRIDSTIRSDLAGVTAKMTPPNDPALKTGYFEYGEGAPADLQGEDTDDFLAFTTRLPEGRVYQGRQWLSRIVKNKQMINQAIQPVMISSPAAEVLYFLRNGNLYRRAFLVAPERAGSVVLGPIGQARGGGFTSSLFGKPTYVSWLGMNDLSARPGGFGGDGYAQAPLLNDLGDLTNRENRAFRPRFLNDFTGNGGPDGIPDDGNMDGLPDYYPTLYYDGQGHNQTLGNQVIGWAPNTFVYEVRPYGINFQRVEPATASSYDVYAFPFIYPGMYSVPDPQRAKLGYGLLHGLMPNSTTGSVNHSPIDIGDSAGLTPSGNQTWWGFPTWRETMSGITFSASQYRVGWTDPVIFVGIDAGTNRQPLGLRPFPPISTPAAWNSANLLPPIYQPGGTTPAPFFDGAGSSSSSNDEAGRVQKDDRSNQLRSDGIQSIRRPTPIVRQ